MSHAKPNGKKIAIVISNPTISTTTGWPVGFWWSELTHPYYAFWSKGYQVTIFSLLGGKCEGDAMSDPRDPSGYSEKDLISGGFIANPKLYALVENTKPISELNVTDFDAIVVAGGQSPMFLFESATVLHKKFVEFYESGKITSALCHGSAIFKYAKLSNGEYLAKGKTITGFTNDEEDYADEAVWSIGALSRDKHVMPWRVEDALKAVGAHYVKQGAWASYAVVDGNLITGQQNLSGEVTAHKIIEALEKL